MIRTIFAFICLLLAAGGAAAQNGRTFRISTAQLTGNVYVYTSYGEFNKVVYPTNGIYIVTKNGVVVMDTPWSEDQTQQLVDTIMKKHHRKITYCIVTHFHADRTAGLDLFKKLGVKTYSSVATLDMCKRTGEKQAQYTFTNDTTFTVGGQQIITYYPGEGHTKDNIVAWLPATRVLYGGCFIKSSQAKNIGYTADGNVKEWPASVARMKEKFPHPAYVIPGHDAWRGSGDAMLSRTLELLSQQQ